MSDMLEAKLVANAVGAVERALAKPDGKPEPAPVQGEPFPCPKCGATTDDGPLWDALYYTATVSSIDVFVGADGQPSVAERDGDNDEDYGYTTDPDAIRCVGCGHEVVLTSVEWLDPGVAPLAPLASRLLDMLGRLLEDTPLSDEVDGEHPVVDDARDLLAQAVAAKVAGRDFTLDGKPLDGVGVYDFLRGQIGAGPLDYDDIFLMEPGDEITYGGGAQPNLVLRRVR